MAEKISLVLIDDHAIVRNGIKSLLENEDYIEIVGEGSNGEEALTIINELQPDIAIMDIRMPVMTGVEATKKLYSKGNNIHTKVLILSMHDTEEYVLQAVSAGAYGYLLKDSEHDDFVKAIKHIAQGKKFFSSAISNIFVNQYLSGNTGASSSSKNSDNGVNDSLITKSEKQILNLIRKGMTNMHIAEELNKSVRTIETHRFNMMKKLKVKNVAELLTITQDFDLS